MSVSFSDSSFNNGNVLAISLFNFCTEDPPKKTSKRKHNMFWHEDSLHNEEWTSEGEGPSRKRAKVACARAGTAPNLKRKHQDEDRDVHEEPSSKRAKTRKFLRCKLHKISMA